jgi:hypothetical protein
MSSETATLNMNIASGGESTLRTWGAGVNALWASAGLVQTSDTGQINWASATKPSGANGDIGYEIWRFNDSLQSVAPVFIRAEWKSSANTSGNNVNLWIQVGTGTDGSGNLTGTIIDNGSGAAFRSGYSVTQAANQSTHGNYISVQEGSVVAFCDRQESTNSTAPYTLIVCRTVDENNEPTPEGLYVAAPNTDGTFHHLYTRALNYDTSTAYSSVNAPTAVPPGDIPGSLSAGGIVVLRHHACIPHPVPVAGVVTVPSNFSEGQLFEHRGLTYRTAVNSSNPQRFASNTLPLNILSDISINTMTNENAYTNLGVLWDA